MNEFYGILFLDQDGTEHQEGYHNYNVAKTYAIFRSRDFGEATLCGDGFEELWRDGEFCEIHYTEQEEY